MRLVQPLASSACHSLYSSKEHMTHSSQKTTAHRLPPLRIWRAANAVSAARLATTPPNASRVRIRHVQSMGQRDTMQSTASGTHLGRKLANSVKKRRQRRRSRKRRKYGKPKLETATKRTSSWGRQKKPSFSLDKRVKALHSASRLPPHMLHHLLHLHRCLHLTRKLSYWRVAYL